jgi:DNA repair photolyase
MEKLRSAGIATYATLAPILPCDPEEFAAIALSATDRDLIGDPLHIRATKSNGATTRDAAWAICQARGTIEWLDSEFQSEVVARIRRVANDAGRRFATGPEGFSWLAQN